MASYVLGFAVGVYVGATLKDKYPIPTKEKLHQIKHILQSSEQASKTSDSQSDSSAYAGVLPKFDSQKPN